MSGNKRHIGGVWPETDSPVAPGERQAALFRQEAATFLRLAQLRFLAADDLETAEKLDELIELAESTKDRRSH